jgi:hypothetical protein
MGSNARSRIGITAMPDEQLWLGTVCPRDRLEENCHQGAATKALGLTINRELSCRFAAGTQCEISRETFSFSPFGVQY